MPKRVRQERADPRGRAEDSSSAASGESSQISRPRDSVPEREDRGLRRASRRGSRSPFQQPCLGWKRVAVCVVSGVLLASIGPLAWAAPPGQSASEWRDDIDKIDAMLRQGKWKPGQRKAHKLAGEVIRQSWYGPGLAQILAELAFLQAAGAANLGERDTAVWYWHMAQNLDRRIRDKDFAPYGEAGKLLREFPLRKRGTAPIPYRVVEPGICRECNFPRLESKWAPEIPYNAAKAAEHKGQLHTLSVELIIDRRGRVLHPVILSPDMHPIAVYGGLEALATMPQFRPAHNYGEAVDTLYKLRVDLKHSRWEQGGPKLRGRIKD